MRIGSAASPPARCANGDVPDFGVCESRARLASLKTAMGEIEMGGYGVRGAVGSAAGFDVSPPIRSVVRNDLDTAEGPRPFSERDRRGVTGPHQFTADSYPPVPTSGGLLK